MSLPLRTVIYEHEFYAEARELVPGAELLDAALEFVTFILTREPEIGQRLVGDTWRIVFELPSGRGAVILYEFDDETVTLMRIFERALD